MAEAPGPSQVPKKPMRKKSVTFVPKDDIIESHIAAQIEEPVEEEPSSSEDEMNGIKSPSKDPSPPKDIQISVPLRKKSMGTPPPSRKQLEKAMSEVDLADSDTS
eukprot:maker-scaffold15_size728074-snap-gene-6.19 protein:Tk08878 transcript:maker-scaffold15_size728074-snap-gene-6.19-mRNA-1 annotation:"cell division protein"